MDQNLSPIALSIDSISISISNETEILYVYKIFANG